jgi:hypothetical protein
MQSIDQRFIHLQERLASSAHNELLRVTILCTPRCANRFNQRPGVRELSASRTYTDKIGIAELTHSARSILFAPRPEIASAEPTEYRSLPSVRALTLKCVEDLLYGVRHFSFTTL